MAVFDDDFPELKIGDVDGIPCASRVARGGRAIARRKYPNRAGARGEDMGREPYTIEYEIALYAGVDLNHYPTLAEQLRALCEDPPEGLEVLDYELGTMPVTIDEWSMSIDPMKRDGVIFRITVTEDQLDVPFQLRELAASGDDAEGAAGQLDVALAEANVSEASVANRLERNGLGLTKDEKDYDAGSLWQDTTASVLGRITSAIMVADQVTSEVDTMRGRINVLLEMAELQDAENGEAYNAAIRLASLISRAGDIAFRDAVLTVEERILAPTSVFELAARLYNDVDRAMEILKRNPSLDPIFIPAGITIEVAAS